MVIRHPILALSMLYHYLREHLTPRERELALAKAREYARNSTTSRCFRNAMRRGWATSFRTNPARCWARAFVRMVFWDEIPEAKRWLAWTHGRMLTGATDAPPRRRNPWSTYGPNFLTSYASAVETSRRATCSA
jgi:hypothetical protein